MKFALDASLAVLLAALLALAGATAIASKTSLFTQGVAFASVEANAISESDLALSRCAEARECTTLSLEQAAAKRSRGLCVRRLVLQDGEIVVIEACAGGKK